MKTMCSPGYHHDGFVVTHTLGPIYVPKWCMSCHKEPKQNAYNDGNRAQPLNGF